MAGRLAFVLSYRKSIAHDTLTVLIVSVAALPFTIPLPMLSKHWLQKESSHLGIRKDILSLLQIGKMDALVYMEYLPDSRFYNKFLQHAIWLLGAMNIFRTFAMRV